MKALLLTIFLFATCAQAQTFRLNNEGGGEIVLTVRDCRYNGQDFKPLKEAYGYHRTGVMSHGCWLTVDGMIQVVWWDRGRADTRVYRIEDFRYVPE